ncbi:MAG TPA: response regulator transcription factor [Blastocatellia bacterium]|nr:response regulator transcription factor [Blastocatellia bacterium]
MRVLVADDSDIVRERLVAMLNDTDGVEVVGEAQDGTTALDLIRRLNPEAVILDMQMPNGTGIGVLEDVKKHSPHIKVIMLTNYAYPQYRAKCLDAGADFFFDKSTEFAMVPEVLTKMIGG